MANPSDACNGVIIVPGTHPCQDAVTALAALGVNLALSNGTPGVNSALTNNNNHSIAPRIGIAWDVKGDGKTAVRFGVGQFFQREAVGIDERLSHTAPFVIGATVNRTLDVAPALTSNLSVSPSAGRDPRGVVPNSWQWNMSVERELARNTALQIGYVGNAGVHLTSMLQGNPVLPANYIQEAFSGSSASAQNAFRGATNFGQINDFARMGHASYHSLQALFRTRTSNSSSFQAAYTYSHSIGDVELDNSSGSPNQEMVTDLANPRLDRGNTNINRPHIFVANEVYYLPKFTNYGALAQNTIGGWELNSIITIESGTSLTVTGSAGAAGSPQVACDPASVYQPCIDQGNAGTVSVPSTLNALIGTGYTGNNRPLLTGTSCNAGESGNQILNAAAFTLVGYHLGTVDPKMAARGVCFGPKTRTFDLQLVKNWYFKENRFRLKFSLDAFNIFNHANFNGGSLESTGYGPGGLVCNGTSPCGTQLILNPSTGALMNVVQDLTNSVVTSQGNSFGGFGQAAGLIAGHESREIQYGLKLTF